MESKSILKAIIGYRFVIYVFSIILVSVLLVIFYRNVISPRPLSPYHETIMDGLNIKAHILFSYHEHGQILSPLLLLVADGQLGLYRVLDWNSSVDSDGLRIGAVSVIDIIEGRATREELIQEWKHLDYGSSWEVIGDFIVNKSALEKQTRDINVPLIVGRRQRKGTTKYIVLYENHMEVVLDWTSWVRQIEPELKNSGYDLPPEDW